MSDTLAILAVLNRYLHAIDAGDLAAIGGCFAEDAEATYADGVGAGGSRAEILAFLAQAGVGSGKSWGASTHSLANWSIEVAGDTAHADTMVEAVLADAPRDGGRTQRRGLRYVDELVRTPAGWRIRRRRHSLLWSYVVEGVTLR